MQKPIEGPRERLAALGSESLSDSELVALILRTGRRDQSSLLLAGELLERCGGLRGLARAGRAQLEASAGIGPAKRASLIAAVEIARRLAAHRLEIGQALRCPEDVHRHYYAQLRDSLQECFVVVMLDGRHRVMGDALITRGTLTASLVHPREVFRPALRDAAAALVLVHNHPSGDPSPSDEDRVVTHRLRRAGDLLGVRVVDHVVVAERGYYSFREAGDLENSRGDTS